MADTGSSYIASHLKYVVAFVILTLVMYYLVGKKGTVNFLLLVLLGQLVIGNGFVSLVKEVFKGS